MLRDPIRRYLSEWRHVQRGATWLAASLRCNGRSATLEEVPFCFSDEDWGGVTLEEFTSCQHNLANNRQTRMLANLSKINCYNRNAMPETERNALMLQSAKENLRDMAFFGLTEYQEDTQYMFERTFHVEFLKDFETYDTSRATSVNMTEADTEKVVRKNRLDIELYQYAKELFLQRSQKMKYQDANSQTALVNYTRITEAYNLSDKPEPPHGSDKTSYEINNHHKPIHLSTQSSEEVDYKYRSEHRTKHEEDRERRHVRTSRRRNS